MCGVIRFQAKECRCEWMQLAGICDVTRNLSNCGPSNQHPFMMPHRLNEVEADRCPVHGQMHGNYDLSRCRMVKPLPQQPGIYVAETGRDEHLAIPSRMRCYADTNSDPDPRAWPFPPMPAGPNPAPSTTSSSLPAGWSRPRGPSPPAPAPAPELSRYVLSQKSGHVPDGNADARGCDADPASGSAPFSSGGEQSAKMCDLLVAAHGHRSMRDSGYSMLKNRGGQSGDQTKEGR